MFLSCLDFKEKCVLRPGFILLKWGSKVRDRVIMSILKWGRETGTSWRWFVFWVERKTPNGVYCSTEVKEISLICHPGTIKQKYKSGFGTEILENYKNKQETREVSIYIQCAISILDSENNCDFPYTAVYLQHPSEPGRLMFWTLPAHRNRKQNKGIRGERWIGWVGLTAGTSPSFCRMAPATFCCCLGNTSCPPSWLNESKELPCLTSEEAHFDIYLKPSSKYACTIELVCKDRFNLIPHRSDKTPFFLILVS